MQTTFKIRNKLPSTIASTLMLNPQVGTVLGSLEARVVGHLSIQEPHEARVAAVLSLTPEEARGLADRLVRAAGAAEAMLQAEITRA